MTPEQMQALIIGRWDTREKYNLVSFTTRRYRREPLVITGPGAGPEVTAAGILNDLQHLAVT